MTPRDLAEATGARIDRARAWLPYLEAAMEEFDINTPLRKAAFLAQIGYESGGLRWLVEIWGPSVAQKHYEGRDDLGNTQPGDGFLFRGRGLLMTTGRYNYMRTGKALGVDLLANPDLLALPELASRSAGWYWKTHGCNPFADNEQFVLLTRRINGGVNGLEDRQRLYEAAKEALCTIR